MNVEMSELGTQGVASRRARSSSDHSCTSGGSYDGSTHPQCRHVPGNQLVRSALRTPSVHPANPQPRGREHAEQVLHDLEPDLGVHPHSVLGVGQPVDVLPRLDGGLLQVRAQLGCRRTGREGVGKQLCPASEVGMLRSLLTSRHQFVAGGLAEERDQALSQAHTDCLEGLSLVAAVVRLERLLPPSPRAGQQVADPGATGTSRSRAYPRRSASPMWKLTSHPTATTNGRCHP